MGERKGAEETAVHRLGEQVALSVAAIVAPQEIALADSLDALGDDICAVDTGDLQQRPHQVLAGLGVDSRGKAPVDLYHVDRIVAQGPQGRIAGPKIVDRDADAEL